MRKKLLVGGVVVLVAMTASGCGSGPTLDGQEIANADQFLADADDLLAETFEGVSKDVAAISDQARCYFEDAGEQEIGSQLFCGPVRMVGFDDPWFTMSYTSKQSRTGDLVLSEPMVGEYAEPTGALFRPDGEDPADPDDLTPPAGPRASAEDFAVLIPVDELQSSMKFTNLKDPATLVQPAATITVLASSDDQLVPGQLLTELGAVSPEVSLSAYRPAEGQSVSAWKVRLDAPPDLAPPWDGWSAPDGARDASMALAVQADDQRIAVTATGAFGEQSGQADGIAKVPCEYAPCTGLGGQQYVLFVSAPEGSAVSVVTTTDGQDERLDLETAAVTTEHSTVAYDRENLREQVSVVWGSKSVEILTPEEIGLYGNGAKSYTYGGEVSAVYITPFDVQLGWAPAGRAWLVVPVTNLTGEYDKFGAIRGVNLDWPSSWTATSGEQVFTAEPSGGLDRAVFQVDASLDTFTVAYAPTGSVSYRYTSPDSYESVDKQKPFAAPEPLTVEVTF